MNILVSACLLGCACRYDGASKTNPAVLALARQHHLVPTCPEIFGGLPTPRTPSERQGPREVRMKNGADVTAQYEKGAAEALRLYEALDCRAALLKARSPSCGRGLIYDGSFTGTLTAGDGVTVQLLKSRGIPVFTEEEIPQLVEFLSRL